MDLLTANYPSIHNPVLYNEISLFEVPDLPPPIPPPDEDDDEGNQFVTLVEMENGSLVKVRYLEDTDEL